MGKMSTSHLPGLAASKEIRIPSVISLTKLSSIPVTLHPYATFKMFPPEFLKIQFALDLEADWIELTDGSERQSPPGTLRGSSPEYASRLPGLPDTAKHHADSDCPAAGVCIP